MCKDTYIQSHHLYIAYTSTYGKEYTHCVILIAMLHAYNKHHSYKLLVVLSSSNANNITWCQKEKKFEGTKMKSHKKADLKITKPK